MRLAAFVALVFFHPSSGRAACPSDCFAGGGPATTDCFVQYGGIASNAVTCTDGDASCDADGKADGVCTLGLAACLNVATASCTAVSPDAAPVVKPTTLAASRDLAAALAALDRSLQGCTPAGYVLPVKATVKGLKPGKAKLTISAVAGGKKDADKLKLACNPSPAVPSLANDVMPILIATCATPSCHVNIPGSGNLNLETAANTLAAVGRASASTFARKLKVIEAGNIGKSYLARKIMDQGLAKFDGPMPQGCPGVTPCLTPSQLGTVLLWIQGGAPNN